jgi:hypothetical protein
VIIGVRKREYRASKNFVLALRTEHYKCIYMIYPDNGNTFATGTSLVKTLAIIAQYGSHTQYGYANLVPGVLPSVRSRCPYRAALFSSRIK